MPKYPIPVVRLLIENPEGRILLLKRVGKYGHGQWTLPGGKAEYGQPIKENAKRELKEETGLDIKVRNGPYHTQDSPPTPKENYHAITLYFRTDQPADLDIILNHESSDFAWVSPEDLGKYDIAFGNREGIEAYLNIKNQE
ncbi:NUDIX hydrolase [Candidatus Woesearchaeota archaeon]|nr:NUDIX hydrolase [Candidatus Woesearchaeota archaeon]